MLITYFRLLDVNECKKKLDDCDKTLAKCTNTIGSFICTCNAGYEGSGKEGKCFGKDLSGYLLSID